jgi:hypothetical protein
MPIRPFLAGKPFEPEIIREIVASKIIELAQRGVRDAPTLSTMTLKEYNR